MEKNFPKLKVLIKTGFFHVFGSSVINKIIAFLCSVVLVRILTKPEFGIFTYAWNIYSIILIFNGLGVESGVLQISSEHSGDKDFADRVSNFGIRFGVKIDLILGIAILLIGLFAPLKIEASRELLCMLCLLPLPQILFQMTTIYLRAQKRNKEFAWLTILNTSLIFAVSAGCAFAFREKGLVVGYYAAYLSSFVIGLLVYRIKIFNNSTPLENEDKKILLKIAVISMINNGLSQLLYLLDVFVLGIVDPQETLLASYKVATMIPTALTFIPQAMIIYLYPYFAEHRRDGKWCLKRYKQVLLGLGGLNLFISAFLFAGAPLIVRLLFGEPYMDAVPVFRILSVNYFFSGTFRIISGNLLVTQRKLKFNLFVAIVSSLTNIVADYFFIQWWGSIGAALATILVVLISSVLSTIYLIHTFRQNQKASSTDNDSSHDDSVVEQNEQGNNDRVLYVSFENSENRASGVNKKISGHINAFKEKGYAVDSVAVYASSICFRREEEEPVFYKSNILPRITLCKWVAKHAEQYKVVYIRFQFFCPFVLNMVKELHKNGVITIMEIPTYPYANELVAQGLKGIPKRLIDSAYGPACSKHIDAFVSPLYDGKIHGKQAIEIYNGIDAEKISPRKPHHSDSISLLAVAMMAPWHGYDRVIEGIHNYYENGGKRNVVLHLVGEGAATKEYQKLIDKYSLGDHVIQHGKKYGEELEAMYDNSDIGVGALSLSKIQVYKTNTLKVLEYIAKGLPVVCEEGEVGIPFESKYRLSIPSDQTAVDIEKVVEFYDSIYSEKNSIDTVIDDVRTYCINNCSVADGLRGVFDFIKTKK